MPPRQRESKNNRAPAPPPLVPRRPNTRSRAHQHHRDDVFLDDDHNQEHEHEVQQEQDQQQEDTDSDSEREGSCPSHQRQHDYASARGLSVNIQRQLIIDISLNGGLDFFRLRDLCNSKPDVYGAINSKLRRKIQNTVARWRKLTPSGYQHLLSRLNVIIPSQHCSLHPLLR
jgi:hypothetical protein